MFILHVALQGCLRAGGLPTADRRYGRAYPLSPRPRRGLGAGCRCRADRGGHAPVPRRARSRIRRARRADLRQGHAGAARERVSGYRVKEEMHAEVQSFAENLIAWIAGQPHAPDLIHAHYADAATVAALVEDRSGFRSFSPAIPWGGSRRLCPVPPAAPVSPSGSPPRRTRCGGRASSSPPPATRRRCSMPDTRPTIPAASGPAAGQRSRALRRCPTRPRGRRDDRAFPGRSGQTGSAGAGATRGAQEPRRPGPRLRREPGTAGPGQPRPDGWHARGHRRPRRRHGRDDARESWC